jgi:protocatechuate 3,4-dioxygenase alpha subunit
MTPSTPSQTVGPFFSLGLGWAHGARVVAEGSPGGVRIRGRVLDGAGDPVPDALIETWQPDADGRFDGERFRGFGRCATDARGFFEIHTRKPGRVPWSSAPDAPLQAPHLAVSVLARGLLNRVVTRIYFGDEAAANAEDPILRSLPEPERRHTLIAGVAREAHGGYSFDVRLQGPDETVFFVF